MSEEFKGGTWVYRPDDPRSNENGMILKHLASPLVRSDSAPMVISDLPEYRAVAADKQTGKRPVIGGRRQHREFLRNNGYREVGNDYVSPCREEMSRSERVNDIKRVLREL